MYGYLDEFMQRNVEEYDRFIRESIIKAWENKDKQDPKMLKVSDIKDLDSFEFGREFHYTDMIMKLVDLCKNENLNFLSIMESTFTKDKNEVAFPVSFYDVIPPYQKGYIKWRNKFHYWEIINLEEEYVEVEYHLINRTNFGNIETYVARYKIKRSESELNIQAEEYRDAAEFFSIGGATVKQTGIEQNTQEESQSLVKSFIYMTVYLNKIIENGKVVSSKKVKSEDGNTVVGVEEEPKRVRVIKVGDSEIIAKGSKAPKEKKSVTLVHYHVSEWSRKGHIRHLKSGKTTFIKPTKCKRKNMKSQNALKKNYIID